jgi:CRP-like cAMP-binding protein
VFQPLDLHSLHHIGSEIAINHQLTGIFPRQEALMSPAPNLISFAVVPEDPLAMLPRTPIRQFEKNTVIYDRDHQREGLHLIIEGRVKVSRIAEGGKEVVIDFCHKDDFFGDMCFLGIRQDSERATAVDKTSIMLWTLPELERLMARTPALGPALLSVLAQKLANANNRIESFCVDPIHRRLAKALLHMADRFGQQADGNLIHLPPLTHEQLAWYVGTSREMVTQYMNQFRREHLLKYSRRGMDLDVVALRKYLGGALYQMVA